MKSGGSAGRYLALQQSQERASGLVEVIIAGSLCGAGSGHHWARNALWIQKVAGVTRGAFLMRGSHVFFDGGSGVRGERSVDNREQSPHLSQASDTALGATDEAEW